MNSVLIELHVPDFNVVRAFYSKLGFEVCWERLPEGTKGYLVMAREGNTLCFWGGNENIYSQEYFKKFPHCSPKGVGVEIVIQVADIRALYHQIQGKIEVFESLRMRPWGLEDFRVVDPVGYYLRFTEKHEIQNPKYAIK